MNFPAKCILLTVGLFPLFFTGCEKAEPTSYLIPKESREVNLPEAPTDASKQASAPFVPVAGDSDTAGGGMPPASSGNSQMQVLPGMAEAAEKAGEVSYTVPEGWEDLPPSGIRKANLRVIDEFGAAELTVLVFPGDVGGRLANINRWRDQIGLEAAMPEDLPAFTEAYTISQHRGLYVRLEGGMQSILGALLPFHGSTWFFKFQGSSQTVMDNEAAMRAFLDSVTLEDDHH
jgi:hypothetical protein